MHSLHASLCSKLLSIFFAVTLVVGLVPSAAFAADESLQSIPEGSEGAAPVASSAEGGGDDVFSHCPSDDAPSADGGSAATSSESVPDSDDHVISTEGPEDPSGEISSPGDAGSNTAAFPAGAMINQEVALDTVAQAESTRSFFLAQTLESTKTVPVVSAKLPIDKGAAMSQPEGEGSESSESDDSNKPESIVPSVSTESTVIGSFEYRGITYAIEPGGESAAIVAADYAKLSQDFIEAQTIVLPSVVSSDNVDYYSVTRIADYAFSSLTAAAAAEDGESADADSGIQAQAEACAYGDQATSNSSIVSAVVDLNDGSDSQHVISSGASEAGGVEKSRPSDEGEGEALTDSTDESTVGITAITIPASVTTIEEDALTGFDTLQYVIASEDNPNYSMYDGCLYDKPLSSLLLIPEGRLGAVRVAPSATTIDPEVFSHCALDTVIADPGSAAYETLVREDRCHDFELLSAEKNDVRNPTEYDSQVRIQTEIKKGAIGETYNLNKILEESDKTGVELAIAASNDGIIQHDIDELTVSVCGNVNLIIKEGESFSGSIDPDDITRVNFTYVEMEVENECSEAFVNIGTRIIEGGAFDGLWFGLPTTSVADHVIPVYRGYPTGGNFYCGPGMSHDDICMSIDPAGPAEYGETIARGQKTLIMSTSTGGNWYSHTYNGWGYCDHDAPIINVVNRYGGNCGRMLGVKVSLDGVMNDEVYEIIEYKSSDSLQDVTYFSKDNLPKEADKTLWITKIRSLDGSKTLDLDGFEITWNGNGGTGHEETAFVPGREENSSLLDALDPVFSSVTEQTNFKSFNEPTRDGWAFDGWYGDTQCTMPLTYALYSSSLTTESNNKDYYAKWKATATWDANGGTLNGPATSEAFSTSYDSSVGADNRAEFAVSAAPTAPDGWEFAGWATTPDPVEGETLVTSGTIRSYANDPTAEGYEPGKVIFYARYKADITFDTSRGMDGATDLANMPATKTVYAKAPVDGSAPVGELSATAIANTASQKWYRFNGYKVTPGASTPGTTTWYAYEDLPAGTVSANDPVGTDATATYTDDMTFTIEGASTFTLLWAPIAYAATFDAGASEYTTAPGTVTGNEGTGWSTVADDAATAAGTVSRKWSYTYTYDMDTVALPNPVLPGYTYEFTDGSGSLLGADAPAAHETRAFDAKSAVAKADPAGMGASPQTLAFAVTWTKSPYEVRVIDNVSPVALGRYAFTADNAHMTTIGFDGANGIVIPQLHPKSTKADGQAYFDDDYMATFTGWTIGKLNDGDKLSTTPLTYTISLADIDEFFATYATDVDGAKVVYAIANFTPRTWTATMNLPADAKASGTWPGWTNGLGDGASRTYDCTTADLTLPDNTAITRFGYTFDAWSVVAKGADGTEVKSYTIVADDSGAFTIPANTVYDLVLSPVWVAATSRIQLAGGAPDAVLAGDTAFSIDFDQKMTQGVVGGGATVNLVVPTRANHTFLGYFDEAGQQYITATLTSARAWNKVPADADAAFTLTARWQSDDLNGDGEADEPSTTAHTPEGGSAVSVRSSDTAYGTAAGAEANVLVGTYNGTMQWSSDAAYPRSFDTVVANVSSYTLGASNAPADIRAAFGESAADARWILGFTVGSQGSFVPFYDIIYGNAITLTLMGSDLVRTGDPKAPAFTVDPKKVKVVWTDTDPGYGDGSDPSKNPGGSGGLEAGDAIVNVFDAGCGAFEDAFGNAVRVSYVTTEVSDSYNGTTDVQTKFPDKSPVMLGYEFLGWSAVPQAQHAQGDGDFKKNTGTPPVITSRATKTYYAHWAPHAYTVAISGNYEGAPAARTMSWTYDTLATRQDVSGVSREGYACVGFFDTPAASGGAMYLDSEGCAVRAWDKGKKTDPRAGETDYTLYARWVSTSASGSEGEADPANPPSADPFPGVPGATTVIPTASDNHSVYMSALDGRGNVRPVLDGTYVGVFRFRQVGESATPENAASVQVMMNHYEPAAGAEAHDAALAAVQRAFEDNANSTTDKYLQGFRVVSTGDFISWADIMAGASVDIDCKGSDLAWDEGGIATPASFRMEGLRDTDHVLVAVYGATPCVDPNDGETTWPVKWPATPATEVRITFDAGVGRFADDTRFLDVKAVYGGTVVLPSESSSLALPEGKAPTYKPTQGWSFECWVDASGAKVTDATSVPSSAGGPQSVTYYAKYTQKKHELTFDVGGGADADDVVNVESGFFIGAVSGEAHTIEPYDGQAFRASDFGYPMPSATTFARPGYDFLGWFDTGDATTARTAYKLTDAGAALMLVEDGPLANVSLIGTDMTMTDETNPHTLYALWAPKEYAVVWHYNYPAYTVGGEQHEATSGEADVYRRGLGANELLLYGQPVDATLLDGPVGGRYGFNWWMEGPEGDADPVDGADASFRDVPGDASKQHFTPVRSTRDAGMNRADYYANWNTGSPVKYTVRLYAGKGGSYGGQQLRTYEYSFNYPDYVLPTVDNENRANYPQTTPGYQFLYWQEADENGVPLADGAQVTTVKTSEGGDRSYVAIWSELPYQVRLTGAEDLNPVVYNREHADAPLQWTKWVHDFDVDSKTIWRLPTAAQMNELNALSGFAYEGKRFVGWKLKGADVADGHVFDTAAYLDTFKSDYRKTEDAVFEAVWTDKLYTVVFSTVTAGGDGTEVGDEQLDDQVYLVSYNAADEMTLPIPVLHSSTGVFSHWDTTVQGTDNRGWTAGTALTIEDIFDAYSYSERDVTPQRPVTGTLMNGERKGEVVTDEPMDNVITLYAVWNGVHHADVPLNVGIAIDPDTGDMMFADNGYLATSNVDEDAVVVEGLTYEMVGADENGGGTEAVFGSILDRATLTMTVKREGSEHEAHLEIPLAEPYQFDRVALADFEAFDADHRLNITYGLDFGVDDPAGEGRADLVELLQRIKSSLPAFDGMGENGWSTQSFPIAKLYYTIGLVPSALTEPTD